MENPKAELLKNKKDFNGFYNENFMKIKLSLMFLGEDEESAEDITQETFERIWLRWTNFPNNYARKKFIKVVSKNMWIDKYRKPKLFEQTEQVIEGSCHYTEEQVLYNELLQLTNKALEKYGSKKKDIFNEIRIKGASYKDVSEKFNVNIKTLERYMSQMTKTVRLYLEKYYIHMLPFLPLLYINLSL